LGSSTAANWVSFDLNISCSSCWGYSLINTLKLKIKKIKKVKPLPEVRRKISRPTMSRNAGFLDTWTKDEENIAVSWHKTVGAKWSEIASKLPGRNAEEVEKFWNLKGRWRNLWDPPPSLESELCTIYHNLLLKHLAVCFAVCVSVATHLVPYLYRSADDRIALVVERKWRLRSKHRARLTLRYSSVTITGATYFSFALFLKICLGCSEFKYSTIYTCIHILALVSSHLKSS